MVNTLINEDESRLEKINKFLTKYWIKQYLIMIVCGLGGAISVKFFLEEAQLLSSGVTGIALAFSRVTGTDFNIFYILFNVPLVIFGMIFIGKRFSINSMLFVLLVAAWREVLNNTDITIFKDPLGNDRMLAALCGALIYGSACAVLFKNNMSTGGVDFITIFWSKRHQKGISKLNFRMLVISFLGSAVIQNVHEGFNVIAMFNEAFGYTVLAMVLESRMADIIYPKYKKFKVSIISKIPKQVKSDAYKKGYHRSFTIVGATGGYENKKQTLLISFCSYYELKWLKKRILKTDPNALIAISRVREIVGAFSIN